MTREWNFKRPTHRPGVAELPPPLLPLATAKATALRVWKVDAGIPVALGSISVNATEADLIRSFRPAMPGPGEGTFTFRLRPIDINGREIGHEFSLQISARHEALTTDMDWKKRLLSWDRST